MAHFAQNLGLMDLDDRKDTRNAIQAFSCLSNNDIRITLRL